MRQLQRAGPVRLRAVREGPRAQRAGPSRRGDPGARGAPGAVRRQREQRGLQGAQGRARRRRRAEQLRRRSPPRSPACRSCRPSRGAIVYDHVGRHAAGGGARAGHRPRRRRRLHGGGAGPTARRHDRRLRGRRLRPLARRTCWRAPGSPTASRSCASSRPTRGGSRSRSRARSDAAGNCEPRFDFVYLDGAKNWTIDGLAVVLVEKLLRPGGWLLMDDLDWTYAQDPHRDATDGIVHRELSEPERTEPHLRAVFELIVAQHPSFTELRVQDEWWGWARKAPGEPRRYCRSRRAARWARWRRMRCARASGGYATPDVDHWTQAGGAGDGEVDGRGARSAGDAGGGLRQRLGVERRGRRPRRARPTGRRRRRRSRSPRTPRARSRCAPARTPAAR